MPRKKKPAQHSSESVRSAVAAMSFWARFKQPSPLLAFPFSELDESIPNARGILSRLPSVPIDESVLYSLRVTLKGSKPAVWRRFLVKSVTLEILHHIIQLTMGWSDSHLHGYEIRKTRVPLVDDGAEIDERMISIGQLYAANIKRFLYTYDFGDNWVHTISIEDSSPLVADSSHPCCIAGHGAAPMEDVGGTQNWSRLLDAIKHPENEPDDETKDLLHRLGDGFSPRTSI